MKEIKAIFQRFMLGDVCDALEQIDSLPGLTMSEVLGYGKSRARPGCHMNAEGWL